MPHEPSRKKRTSKKKRKRGLTQLRTFVPGQILEVTMRCFQSRFMLLPTTKDIYLPTLAACAKEGIVFEEHVKVEQQGRSSHVAV